MAKVSPCIFAFFGDKIGGALLEVGEQVFADQLVHGEDDGAGQGEQGPVAQVDPAVGFRVVRRLFD